MQPLFDNLSVIRNQYASDDQANRKIQELLDADKLVITPLAYIRGRSLQKVYFIVDEAQNLTPTRSRRSSPAPAKEPKSSLPATSTRSTTPILIDSPTDSLTWSEECTASRSTPISRSKKGSGPTWPNSPATSSRRSSVQRARSQVDQLLIRLDRPLASRALSHARIVGPSNHLPTTKANLSAARSNVIYRNALDQPILKPLRRNLRFSTFR